MSCCCRSSKNGGNDASAGKSKSSAPSRQSMSDRDSGADDDERAVNWWRERHQSKENADSVIQQNPAPNNGHSNPVFAGNSTRTTSIEQSQSRMELRNPLQKPYDISRDKPLNPKNGDVIQPSVGRGTIIQDRTNSTSNIEVFQPSISGSAMDPIPLGKVSSSDKQSIFRREHASDRITAIEPVGSEDFLDNPSTAPQPDPSAKYVHKASLKLADKKTSKKKNRKRSIPQLRKQKRGKSDAKEEESRQNKFDDGNLSDVPSDVDSVTKERYLLACHMLKSTLMQKEKSLEPLEREFILSLLGDFEDTSVISEDQVSAVEQATLRLENDPIFQDLDADVSKGVNTRRDKAPPPSPMTAATMQRDDKEHNSPRGPIGSHRPSDTSKSPHTATRATPRGKRFFLANPCNPRSLDNVDTPADIVLVVREDEDLDYQASSDDEDSAGNDGIHMQQNVRFDGWSHHKSAEHPFAILGADDAELKPRVLTPSMMEAFRGFFPFAVSESNFWLKFSLVRDGASLGTLLSSIRTSTHTIIAVETNDGEVFGSFTGTPWRAGIRWFGTGEAFLWRLKKSRYTSPKKAARSNFENEMEVYPYTGYDELIQYCTSKTIAVGGGDWIDNPCPFENEPRGIGFMIDGDLAGGECNSCATFANPRLCKKASASNEFSISNLEVWTLTPCLDVRDAAKMEVQKLFIEENYR